MSHRIILIRDIILIDACGNHDASRVSLERIRSGRDNGFDCVSAPTRSLGGALQLLGKRFSEVIVDTDEDTAFVSARHSDCCIIVAGPSWDEQVRDRELCGTTTRHKPTNLYLLFNRTYPKFSLKSFEGIEPGDAYLLPSRRAISQSMAGLSLIETNAKEADPGAMTAMQGLFEGIYGPFQESKMSFEDEVLAVFPRAGLSQNRDANSTVAKAAVGL